MGHRLGKKNRKEKKQEREQQEIMSTAPMAQNNNNNHHTQQLNVALGGSGPMYSILLVTCYSEGEAGLRTTLDSLTESEYPDEHKLLFVISDGIVKGSGNDRSTPDILIDMMESAHDSFEPYH
jgi:chitin synthase